MCSKHAAYKQHMVCKSSNFHSKQPREQKNRKKYIRKHNVISLLNVAYV